MNKLTNSINNFITSSYDSVSNSSLVTKAGKVADHVLFLILCFSIRQS